MTSPIGEIPTVANLTSMALVNTPHHGSLLDDALMKGSHGR